MRYKKIIYSLPLLIISVLIWCSCNSSNEDEGNDSVLESSLIGTWTIKEITRIDESGRRLWRVNFENIIMKIESGNVGHFSYPINDEEPPLNFKWTLSGKNFIVNTEYEETKYVIKDISSTTLVIMPYQVIAKDSYEVDEEILNKTLLWDYCYVRE